MGQKLLSRTVFIAFHVQCTLSVVHTAQHSIGTQYRSHCKPLVRPKSNLLWIRRHFSVIASLPLPSANVYGEKERTYSTVCSTWDCQGGSSAASSQALSSRGEGGKPTYNCHEICQGPFFCMTTLRFALALISYSYSLQHSTLSPESYIP
jgi:hypothetical protein